MIFAVECPGNNANFMQALVVADDEEGRNARALVFPTPFPPHPDNPNDVLSNVDWHDGGIVSELFVDPEEIDGPCRHEARWRLDGTEPAAGPGLLARDEGLRRDGRLDGAGRRLGRASIPNQRLPA